MPKFLPREQGTSTRHYMIEEATMLAAIYRGFGAAHEVLKVENVVDVPPGPNEVRVRLYASGVNPSDVKNRSGKVMQTMPFDTIIPHSDGAGVVTDVGSGVLSDWVGQRVWVWNAQFKRAFGAAAQYVTLPLEQVVQLPDAASFQDGACIGVPVQTAYRAVTCGSSVEGKTVLIAGGSGTVGRYAVQIAKAKGAAKVIATVGKLERRASIEAAGADVVIDYHSDNLADQILDAAGGNKVDRVIEVEWGLNFSTDLNVIKPEGEIYVYGSAADMRPTITIQQMMMTGVTVHFRSVYLLPPAVRKQAIEDITTWLRCGTLNHEVGGVFSLQDVAKAHVAVETRAVPGHILLSGEGEKGL